MSEDEKVHMIEVFGFVSDILEEDGKVDISSGLTPVSVWANG